MKNKILLTSLCSMLSFGAFAEMPTPPTDHPHDSPKEMNFMDNLTDEQKQCIESYGCKQNEPAQKPDMNSERPKEPFDKEEMKDNKPMFDRPEMTDEEKENMECMNKAMQECGIEMPKPKENEKM